MSLSPTLGRHYLHDHAERRSYGFERHLRRGNSRGDHSCGLHARDAVRSVRERIGTKLELYSLACHALAAFHVPACAGRIRGPEPFAFPASLRIIDSAIQALGEEAHRIRHAEDYEFSSRWIEGRRSISIVS